MFEVMRLVPLFFVLVSMLVLLMYRGLTEERFESLAIATNIIALVHGFYVLGSRLSAEEIRDSKLVWLFVVIVILFLLAMAQLLIVRRRKRMTEEHVTAMLKKNAKQPDEATVNRYIDMAKEVIDEDFFPHSLPESVIEAKSRRRKVFNDLLPEALFIKNNFDAEDFCLPKSKRRGARLQSIALGTLALGLLVVITMVL